MRFKSDAQRRAVFSRFSQFKIGGDYKAKTKIEGKLGKHSKAWRAETELSMFDTSLEYPNDKYREYDIALTEMSPTEFLNEQHKRYNITHYGDDEPIPYETWIGGIDPDKIDNFRKILRGEVHEPMKNIYGPDSKLPIPAIVYNEHGRPLSFQEGRHRGLAAQAEGLETMPVIVAKRHIIDHSCGDSDDSKFSFWERKNNGWYPADSNLPDEFPHIVRKIATDALLNDHNYINPDDEQQLAKLTGEICVGLDKVWKPEWGTRPSGHYIRADAKDAWDDLD